MIDLTNRDDLLLSMQAGMSEEDALAILAALDEANARAEALAPVNSMCRIRHRDVHYIDNGDENDCPACELLARAERAEARYIEATALCAMEHASLLARAERAEADNVALLDALFAAARPHHSTCLADMNQPCSCDAANALDAEHPGLAFMERLQAAEADLRRLAMENGDLMAEVARLRRDLALIDADRVRYAEEVERLRRAIENLCQRQPPCAALDDAGKAEEPYRGPCMNCGATYVDEHRTCPTCEVGEGE